MKPITRQEQLLNSIATGDSVKLEPITREEQYLSAIAGLTDFVPEKPITRKEMFYEKIFKSGGGGGGEGTEPGKPYIDTRKMTNFQCFCMNDRLNDQIGYLDTSNGTAFGEMFSSCTFETHPPINTSKGQYFQQMYMYCNRLKTIPHFDTANGENFNSTFQNCAALETVSITTAKKKSFNKHISGL
jgi:hypothetical protein